MNMMTNHGQPLNVHLRSHTGGLQHNTVHSGGADNYSVENQSHHGGDLGNNAAGTASLSYSQSMFSMTNRTGYGAQSTSNN